MIAPVLALALAVSPGAPGLAQAEDWELPYDGEEDDRPRLFLSVWGGDALDTGGAGSSSAVLGGEVAWAFSSLDLGVAAYGYRDLRDAARAWTPVALLRLTQRFETGRGVDATFSFGVGAGRPDDWKAWFQVALGVRVPLGPIFLGGELAFEQLDLLRLMGGLGLAF